MAKTTWTNGKIAGVVILSLLVLAMASLLGMRAIAKKDGYSNMRWAAKLWKVQYKTPEGALVNAFMHKVA